MDKIDKNILSVIQKNATVPLTELTKKVGISSTPCWNGGDCGGHHDSRQGIQKNKR